MFKIPKKSKTSLLILAFLMARSKTRPRLKNGHEEEKKSPRGNGARGPNKNTGWTPSSALASITFLGSTPVQQDMAHGTVGGALGPILV